MILTDNSVYIPNSMTGVTSMLSTQIANALSLELFNYGVVIQRELFTNMITQPPEVLWPLAQELRKRHTVGDLTPALFQGWESRTFFSIPEMVIQIFGYMVQLSGNDLYNENYMVELKSSMFESLDNKDFEEIQLAASNDVSNATQRTAAVVQNRKQKGVVNAVVNKGEWIPSPEARTAAMLNAGIESFSQMKLAINDPMRFFAARLDDTQWILPSDVKFDSMTWQERKATVAFLNSFSREKLLEGMGHNRSAWKRFIRHSKLIRQKQFANKYPEMTACLFISLGNNVDTIPTKLMPYVKNFIKTGMVEVTESNSLVYRTFASRVQTAINSENYRHIHMLMETNYHYLLQNIAKVSNGVAKENKQEFLALVRQALSEANQQTLFSILQIDTKATFRIVDIKGITSVQEAKYSDIIAAIQLDIEIELRNRYGITSKIVVDDELKDKIVPFLAKNQNIDRGEVVSFSEEKYLYFFMKWIQTRNRRTDLDHSWLVVKDSGSVSEVAFYNSANSFISQSGDITNAPAPNGATEYSKINLNKIPDDVKYVIPVINVYSGDNFKDLDDAYAGFMFTDTPKFSINNEHTRYDLDQAARVNMPFAIDCHTDNIIITDYNVKNTGYGIAKDAAKEVIKVADASKTLNKMTIQMFADLLGGDNTTDVVTISNKGGINTIKPENLSDFLL